MDKRIPNAVIRKAWLDPNLSKLEAGAVIGLSHVRLWVRATALGLPPRKCGRRPVIPEGELRVLWCAGVLSREIAALYGCPEASVRQAARRVGLPRRPMGYHETITLQEFRAALLRRSMQPGEKLTDADRSILARTRQQ